MLRNIYFLCQNSPYFILSRQYFRNKQVLRIKFLITAKGWCAGAILNTNCMSQKYCIPCSQTKGIQNIRKKH